MFVKTGYRHYSHTIVLHTYITFWLSYAYDLLRMLYDVASCMSKKYIVFWSVLFHAHVLHLTSLTSYLLWYMGCTYRSNDPQQWKLTRSYNLITRFLNLYSSPLIITWVTWLYYGHSRTSNTQKMQIHTNLAKDRKRPRHSCKDNIKMTLWNLRHDDRFLIGLGIRSSGSLLSAR
jgi:hypothetical protein